MKFVDVSSFDYQTWYELSQYQEKLRGIWLGMKQRCCSPKANAYKNYGDRGITVSDNWLVFATWYNEFGRYRPSAEYSMDRINNDEGYSLENCRWATRKEQASNTRCQKRVQERIEKDSKESFSSGGQSIVAMAAEIGIKSGTLQARISAYDPELHGDDYEAYLKTDKVKIATHTGVRVTVSGQEFRSKAQAAKHFGIPRSTWKSRVEDFEMTFEEAILADPKKLQALKKEREKETKRNNTHIEFDGKTFSSIDDLCLEYGLTKPQYFHRRKLYDAEKHGEYVQYMLHDDLLGYEVVIEGKQFRSKAAAYAYYGITQHAVLVRMEKGWTFEQAVLTPKRQKQPITT
jgi:hypothetical protein